MDSLSPNFFVNDITETIAFYKQLGFETTVTVPEEGNLVWAMMMCGSVTVMFQTFQSIGETMPEISRQKGGSLLLYIKLKGVRDFHDRLQKDNVEILHPLSKTFYGATEFSVLDNNGYVLTFAEDEAN